MSMSMGVYGYLWVFVGYWVSMGIYGCHRCLWVFMGFRVSIRMCQFVFLLKSFNSVDIILKMHLAYGIRHKIFSRWR